MNNRRGRFNVSFDFIEAADISFQDKLDIFKDIFIIDCRPSYVDNKIDYVGISELFDEVQPGYLIPEYVCYLTRDNEGNVSGKWEKLDAN